ncbi:MAG: TetR family transcriptional regulator [Deltaproteobacteria bacterium]|nr:TetR family transcriptional regulator [Deltaproteobacteria bacterium]
MARKKDKAPIRRKEILEHFQNVIVDEGVEGASIAKIANRMGTHPSLLIHYFSSKEEMIIALVDFILEQYETTFVKKLDEIHDPAQRFEALLNTIFGVDWISLVDTKAFYACYYLSLRNERVKVRFQKMYMRFRNYLIHEIEMCMKEGIIAETEPQKDADFIIALVEGLSFYRNISGGRRTYRELGLYLKEKALTILKQQ